MLSGICELLADVVYCYKYDFGYDDENLTITAPISSLLAAHTEFPLCTWWPPGAHCEGVYGS